MKFGGAGQAKATGFFYGWVVVATAFCVALVAYGIQYSFGIFLKPFAGDFIWTRSLVSGAISFFMFSRGAVGNHSPEASVAGVSARSRASAAVG